MNGTSTLVPNDARRFRACGVGLFMIAAMLAFGGGRVYDAYRGVRQPAEYGALESLRRRYTPSRIVVLYDVSYSMVDLMPIVRVSKTSNMELETSP